MRATLLLAACLLAVAFLPTAAQANHGLHMCTDVDPCENRSTQGCSGTVAIECDYERDWPCYSDMSGFYCYHGTYHCHVSIMGMCRVYA